MDETYSLLPVALSGLTCDVCVVIAVMESRAFFSELKLAASGLFRHLKKDPDNVPDEKG